MRQDHGFLPQNVRQKNVDDMRRKTKRPYTYVLRYGRFAVLQVSKQLHKYTFDH